MAWRQGTTALRTGRTMLILGPVLFGIALLLGIYNERVALGVVNTVLIYLTLILLAQLRYDFRGDIDNIPWLKTLPVGAVGLAAGQLVIPVVIAALTLLSALAGLWAAIPSARLPLTAAMAFVPVVVLLLFGVENAFFLIFPSRSFVLNVGELQSMGRFVVVFSCKALVLGVSAGLALALGGLAWLAAGHSLVAAGVAAWLVVGAAACGTVPVVAWAFRRFDPGADIPA